MTDEKKLKKLLYVEDDLPSLDTVQKLIRKWYDVDGATTPAVALEKVKSNQYDAILMDIGLGQGMNGIELTDLIREVPGYENVPVIAVTAFASITEKREIMSHQLTHYISKPFYREDLLKIIDEAIKQSTDNSEQ